MRGHAGPWCERESANETVFELGLSAADWWEEALPGMVHRQGTLVVAQTRDRMELERFARRTHGYQWLDEAGIAALEPALAGRCSRGLYFAVRRISIRARHCEAGGKAVKRRRDHVFWSAIDHADPCLFLRGGLYWPLCHRQ